MAAPEKPLAGWALAGAGLQKAGILGVLAAALWGFYKIALKYMEQTHELLKGCLPVLVLLLLASCASPEQLACERHGDIWNDGLLECHKLVVLTPDGYWPPSSD